ncbi:fungal hydrophobin [Penicillium chermesinum]|uniref:Hydrophobin n=1 Tax=Penicillium chermesinum TaxID=63820 RepID=A0A9W9P301_9EURO|nr:fungal hydrophobin [Penicillium chermesinum]KAJ5233068.1 fungal hydrophobin [Penicillium chermesinum]
MRFALISVLSLVGAAVASPHMMAKRDSECVGDLLCCGTLTTPLDPIVDPLLEELGIDAANLIGSVGLLCSAYKKDSCDSAPQCCTEANLLVSIDVDKALRREQLLTDYQGGELALGCEDYK